MREVQHRVAAADQAGVIEFVLTGPYTIDAGRHESYRTLLAELQGAPADWE